MEVRESDDVSAVAGDDGGDAGSRQDSVGAFGVGRKRWPSLPGLAQGNHARQIAALVEADFPPRIMPRRPRTDHDPRFRNERRAGNLCAVEQARAPDAPMIYNTEIFEVSDINEFKRALESLRGAMSEAGGTELRIYRCVDNPTKVLAAMYWPDAASCRLRTRLRGRGRVHPPARAHVASA